MTERDAAAARERAEERLTRLVGRALEQHVPADHPDYIALLAWLAGDARACQSPAARAHAVLAGRTFADMVLARRAVARARRTLRCIDAPAPERRGDVAAAALAVDVAAGHGCAPLLELSVAAGAGRALWEQECDRWIELPAGVGRDRHVALGVAGDSMLPLLAPGDTMLVRLDPRVTVGAIVVAQTADEGYVVKQVQRVTRRELELRSLNPAYAPFRIARRPGAVLGRVLARWRG